MADKEYFCTDCNVGVILPAWRLKNRKQPFRCTNCARIDAAETYKSNKILNPEKWEKIQQTKRESAHRKHSKTTFEERSIHGKKMRNAVKITGKEMRAKQQDFINNAGEEYYAAYCAKRKKISLEFHANMTPLDKEDHYRKVFKNNGRSKACDNCFDIIEEHGFQLKREKCIHGFFVDGLIEDTNIIIEFYGDMFHCNPTRFHDPEQYCSWISRTVQEQWDRDRKRIAALLRYGYKVVIIGKKDWTKDKLKQIERIKNEKDNNEYIRNVSIHN